MGRDVQEIVDELAIRIGRPTAVDDTNFRLQFYSPQLGPLDEVRVQSILNRDSPKTAKEWVESFGVRDATTFVRLPASESVGILSRICVPVRYEGSLLGFLWVIDDEGLLTKGEVQLCMDASAELAPLLFRRRTQAAFNRSTQQESLVALTASDGPTREKAARILAMGGVLAEGIRPVAIVSTSATTESTGFSDAVAVRIELKIERLSALISAPYRAHFWDSGHSVSIVGANDREVSRHGVDWFATHIQESLAVELPDHRIVVGVGGPQPSLSEAYISIQEARDAARILHRVKSYGDVANIEEFRYQRTFLYVPDEVLSSSVDPKIVDLMSNSKLLDLAKTAEAFLDSAGNVATTGSLLGIHRASVYKRLSRLADDYGIDLHTGKGRQNTHLAFLIGRLLGWWPIEPEFPEANGPIERERLP